ncbi:MAG: PadR family transcriptional regulator [Luteitalea sp.]|nr:PadR family transcriptional regulator [Luteitalea sp.]
MRRRHDGQQSHVRLKTRHYYILLSLAEGDRHGLAIAREVRALSDDRVRLWPATLYGSLEELRARGWIEELDNPRHRPADESERKRIYRITKRGRALLAAETELLEGLVRMARSRLKPRPGAAS